MNPQLDKLRKEKDDLNRYNINQNEANENQRILIAFDYFEHANFVKNSDAKAKQYAETSAVL